MSRNTAKQKISGGYLETPRVKLRNELIKAQFEQIKDAVKSTRQRMHQLSLAAVLSFPAGVFIANSKGESFVSGPIIAIFTMSPIIILGFALLYRSEKEALSKYGHYQNVFIDPFMGNISSSQGKADFVTWETFVRGQFPRQPPKLMGPYEWNRNLSQILLIATYILTGCFLSSYYIVSYFLDKTCSPKTHTTFIVVVAYIEALLCWNIWNDPKEAYEKALELFGKTLIGSIILPLKQIAQILEILRDYIYRKI